MSKIKRSCLLQGGQIIEISQGDITEQALDAIVNAANQWLQHGGGVAGAIARKGGPVIQEESNRWVEKHGPVRHDSPAYTGAGNLPCRLIIHAVGPVWGQGDEDSRLSTAVKGCLELANSLQIKSLAMPAISTGIYGFPKHRAARVILASIQKYFQDNPHGSISLLRLTLWDEDTLTAFEDALDEMMSKQE